MKSSKSLLVVLGSVVLLSGGFAHGAGIDMNDPRRALAREDDLRIDAELAQDVIGSNSSLCITYQIENLSQTPVAVADRIISSDYDPDSATITVSIGSEVPNEGM